MSGDNTKQNPTIQSESEEEIHVPEVLPHVDDAPRSSRLPRFLLPTVIGLAVLGGVGWIVFNRVILPMMMFSQMKPHPTPVQLGSPKSARIENSSDYAASLDSRQSVSLQPRVSGQISAIYVKAGDRVQAGQPLLQIDAAEQRAQVASRNAAVETAAAEIDAAKADVANASDTLKSLQARRAAALADVQLNQREYERYRTLQNQGAVSRQVLDQKLNAIQTARATLLQAEADIRAQQSAIARAKAQVARSERALQQAQANVAEGRARLRFYTITAPFAGVVGNIPVKVGDMVDNVSPNSSSQLLTITQNQQLEIQIAIPLEKAADLRLGLPVKLLDDSPSETLSEREQVLQTGQISFIAPNVDPTTQSVQVKAAFSNSGDRLRTKQFVRARVVWDVRPGVLVPTTAISRLGGRDFIFVSVPFKNAGCQAAAQPTGGASAAQVDPEQTVAAQKPIKLGKIVGNDQEVIEGVSTSDRIVTAGILQLQNCMPIVEDTTSKQ